MSVYVGERDVVSVVGPEATSYLQGQISQDVLALREGESAWSLILQPQGKVDAWFRISKSGGGSYLLDVDPGFGNVLVERLQRFKLRTAVQIDVASWTLHAYGSAEDALGIEAPIVAVSAMGDGIDVVGPQLDEPTIATSSAEDYLRRRISAGVPAMGAELTEATIPAEARIVDQSVSFTKGCYTGQELVARVDSRGDNTPRRLRIVSGDGVVPSESTLELEGTVAGELTSVVADGDGWLGLAYVKRAFLDAQELSLLGETVTVRPVPSDQP